MANNDGFGEHQRRKTTTLQRAVISAFVSAVLLTSIVVGLGNGMQEAHAAKGGKSDDSADRGNSSEKVKSKNSTNTTSSSDKEHKTKHNDANVTDTKSNNGKKPSEIEEHISTLKKAEKLKSHQHGNETSVSGPYSTNSTYFIEANGTARAIGANGSSSEAELSIEMSIWKTKKNMISMDVLEGSSISVDGQTMEFYSGQAHYIPIGNKMLLTGFIMVESHSGESELENEEGDNQTGTSNHTSTATNQTLTVNTNQTSIDAGSNQTSTTNVPSGEEMLEYSEDGPSLRHIKLWIKVTGDGLMATESELENTVEILSPQSKIASQWFLDMSGEIHQNSSS